MAELVYKSKELEVEAIIAGLEPCVRRVLSETIGMHFDSMVAAYKNSGLEAEQFLKGYEQGFVEALSTFTGIAAKDLRSYIDWKIKDAIAALCENLCESGVE